MEQTAGAGSRWESLKWLYCAPLMVKRGEGGEFIDMRTLKYEKGSA